MDALHIWKHSVEENKHKTVLHKEHFFDAFDMFHSTSWMTLEIALHAKQIAVIMKAFKYMVWFTPFYLTQFSFIISRGLF